MWNPLTSVITVWPVRQSRVDISLEYHVNGWKHPETALRAALPVPRLNHWYNHRHNV
jgi:hypothetical protein